MKNWGKKAAYILLPLSLSGLTYASSSENIIVPAEGSSLSSQFNMGATNLESDKNNAKLFGVGLIADYSWELNDSLIFDIAAGVSLEKGSSNTTRDNNEYEANNSLSLQEAKITYKPINQISLSVGALKQNYIEAPMLLSSSAFLGAREEISGKLSNIKLTIGAQQVIPNNKNTSERLGDVEEGNPAFYNEFIDIRTDNKMINLGARVQHFAFDKLSSSVAEASHKMGNTPSGVKGNNDFVSSFIGWHSAINGEVNINNNLSLNAKYNQLENTSADEKHNSASLIGVGAKISENDQNYFIGLESFNIESEAAVAFYNSKSYGHTNKKGQLISLGYENELHNFTVKGSYSSNEVIDTTNTNQSNENIITIQFGKSYDLF
jgi:hypothetical protein